MSAMKTYNVCTRDGYGVVFATDVVRHSGAVEFLRDDTSVLSVAHELFLWARLTDEIEFPPPSVL